MIKTGFIDFENDETYASASRRCDEIKQTIDSLVDDFSLDADMALDASINDWA